MVRLTMLLSTRSLRPSMTPEPAMNAWQRLPKTAVAALYINGVQKAVRENLFLFFGAGTGAFVSDSFGLRETGLVGGGLLLVGLLVTLIYHRRFRYIVHEDAVCVRRGLFEQKELKVRFERIQNVAFSQPIYLKPLGLTRVNLETPGAAQTEVELPGIPFEDALALRQRIAGLGSATDAVAASVADRGISVEQDGHANTIFAPGFGDLFRYGMTSNQLWVVLGVIGGPLANRVADQVGEAVDWLEASGLIGVGELSAAPWLAAALVLAAIALFISLGLMLSGLIAVVRLHGYRLRGDAQRLRAEYGLLDRREKALKRTKLHGLEIVQTAIGRLLGRWHAVGHQAALDAMNPVNQDKRFLVPGIRRDRLDAVVSELADRKWSEPEFQAIDRRFRRFYWQRLVLLPLLVLLVFDQFSPRNSDGVAIGLLLIAAGAAFLVHLRWKRWGVSVGAVLIQVRQGLFGSRLVLFEDARCQQVSVTRSPYQRRHGLATLVIRLPHGETRIPYLSEPLAAELANRLLYRIETSRSHAL